MPGFVRSLARHDEQRRRLLAPDVSPGGLRGLERREEPVSEIAFRTLERVLHRRPDRFVGHEVGLHREPVAREMSRRRDAARPRVRRDAAAGIDHRDLPNVPSGVILQKRRQRLRSGEPVTHEGEPARPVVDVRDGLGRHGADAGFRPRHDRADGEVVALDGDAERSRRRISRDDGVGVRGRKRTRDHGPTPASPAGAPRAAG